MSQSFPIPAVRFLNWGFSYDEFRETFRRGGMVGSDGLPTAEGQMPHPRLYAAMPHALKKFVREEGLVSLPQAIRQITSIPADLMGLTDRGRLLPGKAADITIFDFEHLEDGATYLEPFRKPSGFRCVLVNGQLALENDRLTGVRRGRVLRS